ncbi:hypothetical protein EYC80_005225 [Monilinia laxa]|uniref:Uncharacterized protein n=1 Tax=Monilinia laxa TaxID=61186 RepID=A0A5N6KJA7_MONLA|nr:hypothetical protein EYC80_005225 [Monilinia laxa]
MLDITDFERVRYYFVNFGDDDHHDENEDEDEKTERQVSALSMTPLTEPQYLWGYCKENDPSSQKIFGDLVENFRTFAVDLTTERCIVHGPAVYGWSRRHVVGMVNDSVLGRFLQSPRILS